ncbi:MAG: hypothetical protein KGL35_22830, partial [Bradyrhizobium sp.]|nr:hypothetical protein [Bradyrhizobium sp.]
MKWIAASPFVRLISLALAGAGSILANSNAAIATPWEKLPDGRVIIQVKNVRLAFPADAADANDIEFTDRYQLKSRMSLKEIIAEPDLAQKLFSDARLVYVDIPNLIDRKGLYLGQFPRSDFPSFSASLVIGEGAQAGCEYAAARSARLSADLAPDDARIKATGWAEFETSKHPLSLTYVRPDASHPDFFPGISCDYFNFCGSDKCVGADASIAFQFSGRIIK